MDTPRVNRGSLVRRTKVASPSTPLPSNTGGRTAVGPPPSVAPPSATPEPGDQQPGGASPTVPPPPASCSPLPVLPLADPADASAPWSTFIQDGRVVVWRPLDGDGVALSEPAIAERASGPVLSLVAMLLLPPREGAEGLDLAPDVRGGRLTLGLTVQPAASLLEAVGVAVGTRLRSPRIEKSELILQVAGAERPLGTLEGARSRDFSLELSADETRAVMLALSRSGRPEGYILEARYHVATDETLTADLRGEWAALFAVCREATQSVERITQTALDRIAATALARGALTLRDEAGQAMADPVLAAQMLWRLRSLFLLRDGDGYALKETPPTFPLSVREITRGWRRALVTIRVDLMAAIDRAMEGVAFDNHFRAVVLDQGVVGRAQTDAASRKLADGRRSRGIALTSGGDLFDPAVLSAPALASSALMKPALLKTNASRPNRRNLPVLHTGMGGIPLLMNDRHSSKLKWYAPFWELVPPEDGGVYSFVFRRVGVTSGGDTGLAGELRFSCRTVTSAEQDEAIAAANGAGLSTRPTPYFRTDGTFGVPYIDVDREALRQRYFKVDVRESTGLLDCRVTFLNEWVRLAYGALSHEGFQTVKARVYFQSYFAAYERAGSSRGGAFSLVRAAEQAFLPRALTSRATAAPLATGSQVVATPNVQPAVANWLDRPLIQPDILERAKWGWSKPLYTLSRRHNQQSDPLVFVACRAHPDRYVENDNGSQIAIGCQDALLLGRAEPTILDEISQLRSDAARVFRLTHQADRFMVLPARYVISRTEEEDGSARPAVSLTSVLDPEDGDATHFTFDVFLQPALSPAERQRILQGLAVYSTAPVLDFPTEADLTDFRVTLVSGGEITAIPYGHMIQVSITARLHEAVVVKARLENDRITGSARFVFSDETVLSSSLNAALREVEGPWDTGPLTVRIDGTRCVVQNICERPQDLYALALSGPRRDVQTAVQIRPGETTSVDVHAAHATALAESTDTPGTTTTLEETRVFIERLRRSVVFVAAFTLADHSVSSVEIDARVGQDGQRHRLVIAGETRTAEASFELPITAMLNAPELSYSLTYRNSAGAISHTITDTLALNESAIVNVPAPTGGEEAE